MTEQHPTPPIVNTPLREPTNEELRAAQQEAARRDVVMPTASAREPRPSRPSRHIGRKIAKTVGSVALVLALVGGVWYVTAPTHTSTESWTEQAKVSTVQVELAAGDVTVTQSPDDKVHFSEDLHYRGGERRTTHTVKGDTLVISTEKQAGLLSFPLSGKLTYAIQIPRGTNLDLDVSAGDMTVTGTYGTVKLDVSAGDIEGKGLTADVLDIDLSAGNVELSDVRIPTVSIDQSAGDSTLRFADAPTSVRAKVSAGDVRLFLPGSVTYQITEKHSAGKVTIEVPRSTEASDHRIDVNVSAGDVVIKPA